MAVEQYLDHTLKYFQHHPASVEIALSGPWCSMPSPRLFLMSSSLSTICITLFSSEFLLFKVLRWAELKIKKKLCIKAYLFPVLTPKACFFTDTLLLCLREKLILFSNYIIKICKVKEIQSHNTVSEVKNHTHAHIYDVSYEVYICKPQWYSTLLKKRPFLKVGLVKLLLPLWFCCFVWGCGCCRDKVYIGIPGWPQTHCITQSSFCVMANSLPQPPEC